MFVKVWGTWGLFDFLLSVKVLSNMNPPGKVWQWFGCSPCWCIHWSFSWWDVWEGRSGASTGPRHRCVTSSGTVAPAEHSSTGLATGIEAQVNQDSTKHKGEQTDLLILKCAAQVLAPSHVFSKPSPNCRVYVVPSQRQPSSAPTVSLASPRHVGTAPEPALCPGGGGGCLNHFRAQQSAVQDLIMSRSYNGKFGVVLLLKR